MSDAIMELLRQRMDTLPRESAREIELRVIGQLKAQEAERPLDLPLRDALSLILALRSERDHYMQRAFGAEGQVDRIERIISGREII